METLSGSVCRACRYRLSRHLQQKQFSTSSRYASIPPESPHFIDVPSSHQANQYIPRRVKGIVPIPRELFPVSRPDKPSEDYIRNASKDPKAPVDLSSLDKTERYKAQMTLLRKQHFREGLTELYRRKQDEERFMTGRSDTRNEERARLLSQAEREDARLTNSSIPQAMKPAKIPSLSVAEEMKIYEAKKANLERRNKAKEEARQDALHTLYMNARNFITTEQQLADKIQKEFDDKDFGGTPLDPAKSYWEAEGVPDTVKQMVDRTFMSPRSERGPNEDEAYRKDQERMKKIAEKLSGGKI